MARKRVVSRTITTTVATAMVCNVSSASVETKEYTVSLKLDKEQALKEVKRVYETDTLKIVAIQDVKYNEQLYAMPEIEFLKYAEPVSQDEVDDNTDDEQEKPKKKKK